MRTQRFSCTQFDSEAIELSCNRIGTGRALFKLPVIDSNLLSHRRRQFLDSMTKPKSRHTTLPACHNGYSSKTEGFNSVSILYFTIQIVLKRRP